MRAILAIIILTALSNTAFSDPLPPARVIEITKENAERSAAIIAAAKSSLIGMPPPSKTVRLEPDWKNARAESPRNRKVVHPAQKPSIAADLGDHLNSPDAVRVQIIKRGSAGIVVESHLIPKERR